MKEHSAVEESKAGKMDRTCVAGVGGRAAVLKQGHQRKSYLAADVPEDLKELEQQATPHLEEECAGQQERKAKSRGSEAGAPLYPGRGRPA